MYYGGRDYVSYLVNIPKPRAAEIAGVVIVERTSKNRYNVCAWQRNTILSFSAGNIDEIIRVIGAMERKA